MYVSDDVELKDVNILVIYYVSDAGFSPIVNNTI